MPSVSVTLTNAYQRFEEADSIICDFTLQINRRVDDRGASLQDFPDISKAASLSFRRFSQPRIQPWGPNHVNRRCFPLQT